MRFTRDRRGYETTALLHAGGRRRGKGQRVLYYFRTPPGVRVGRAPIDEDAIRLLEQHNPDVQFDWTRILKDPQPAEPPRREGREGRDGREGRERRREPRPQSRPEASPAAQPPERAQPSTEYEQPGADYGAPAEYAAESAAEYADHAEVTAVDEPEEPGASSDAAASAADPASAYDGGMDSAVDSAVYRRLGAEGLGRLRARYAEVMARIAEQPVDEPAREQLKLRAERLNPDGWVTADEVTAALEQYEAVFEELRAVVGREPRRRRRRR